MRIEHIDDAPFHRIPYLNAAKRGGTETNMLELRRGRASGLGACEALLITGDLQGMSASWQRGGLSVLLGEVLAEQLETLAEQANLPQLAATGVVLAGDLYSVPEANKRGGLGDVTSVWHAFADRFGWVAGVAGNHDDFGREKDKHRLTSRGNVFMLDGDVADVDGLSIGGVGYISGNPQKHGRRSEDEQLAHIELVLEQRPDLLVLHEGPNGDEQQPGNPRIRTAIASAHTSMTACGHVHWADPLCALDHERQIVNVDARALLLIAV